MKQVTLMIRRAVTTALLGICCASLYATPEAIASAERTAPNILVLMAEDLSPRIGAYGDAYAQTPNIDDLARKSTRYTHAFTTAGVCAPSRAAFITGQHQIAFGGQHMRTSTSPLGFYLAQPDREVRAFPELLRAHGYYTFTDRKLDYQFSGIRAHSGPFTIWDEEDAADTAWRNREGEQPFFGLINFIETHESGVMRQTGPTYAESHAASQVMRAAITKLRESVSNPGQVLLPPYFPDVAEVRRDVARHYDNIHLMDKRVGRILSALAADGLLDNTIVVWTTDHGDGLPRSKRELYDSGTRVPLLIARPDRPAAVDDRLLSFVDLAPTILGWAGIKAPDWLHGRSIDEDAREFVFSSRDRIDEVMDRQRSVRSARYRYIRSWYPEVPGGHELNYRDNIDMVRKWRSMYQANELNPVQARWFQPAGEEQLYDLLEDPHEVHDLSDNPDYSEILQTLRNELNIFLVRVGDRSQMPEIAMRNEFLEDNALPITPPPRFSVDEDNKVTLISPIGASIGYRHAGQSWYLYTEPLKLNKFPSGIEAKSVRYGWKESETVRLASKMTKL